MSDMEISSGNVYADLGMENADEMLVKAQLAAGIREILKDRGLTQMQEAEIVGLPQPKLSRLLNGTFAASARPKC